MKAGKKKALRVILCIILVFFVLINICWYVWRASKYGPYSKGMEKNVFATWIVPRYSFTDDDGFDYGVKYPDYLSLTGNLSVGLPAADGNPFTDFLIIWPQLSGVCRYGVSLTVDDVTYQIYIKSDGSAVSPEDSEVAVRCQETINVLLRRAEKMWNLE